MKHGKWKQIAPQSAICSQCGGTLKSNGIDKTGKAYIFNAVYKYCPFCGKEIKSVLYEKTKTNDEIVKLKNKLKELKNELDYSTMFINFEWKLKKRTPEEITKILEEHKKEVETNGGKFTNEKY